MTLSATERVRAFYDRAAPQYDASIRLFERLLFGDGRAWVCSRAWGDVLEIGIGTGRNLPYYPAGVRLTGIDVSPAMLAIARRRAEDLGRAVDLYQGDAECLGFAGASFDSVVCTLSLCTIPDDRQAVAEAARVLRPGGRLLLLEHVRSPLWLVRLGQRLLDPLFAHLEGDHLLRDPLDYLGAEGFAVEMFERSKWGLVERVAARRTDSPQGGTT
jgi:ubiquinone/menaquinone biosynthesis C-methylase UbiE